MRMTDEEFDEIMKNIEWRRVYVDKYYKLYTSKPQWIRDDGSKYSNDAPDFETWMKAEIRDEKLRELGL